MGFRFRRSISVCPGVRINIGKSGVSSMSIGPRGASVTVGKRGTHANIGLPGTGLSYRKKMSDNSSDKNIPAQVDNSELIKYLETIESEMDCIINIHLLTPNINNGISFQTLKLQYQQSLSVPFNIHQPLKPTKPIPNEKPILSNGIFAGFFDTEKSKQQHQIQLQADLKHWEENNIKNNANYIKKRIAWANEYALWHSDKTEHDHTRLQNQSQINELFSTDRNFFENKLNEALALTEWPRETNISFEVILDQSLMIIDVDLPEFEDIPEVNFRLNKKGDGLLEKQKSGKQIRLEYAQLVHGILMRIAGIGFYCLPLNSVKVSGYTQRINNATGYVEDEYILAVEIQREAFSSLNFDALDNVNPVHALEQYNLSREMSVTGLFKKLN
ncbi:conserved hypothetical protein [Psychromonas ingrahamii 37]|uniref:DUF4236 domain-containing protein n=1 Tax=Psychromonas ingrahamii (strain DSM 17664 / CCUG 51855 / 37) TaxID=357804 RepID=A1SXS9_PSYIN|nr:DUF4236 domain-containing protein [Psychromonas ingrahamii]ABM04294.1 conserved hypothetical protein [Psychromonas ingrahamii 37]